MAVNKARLQQQFPETLVDLLKVFSPGDRSSLQTVREAEVLLGMGTRSKKGSSSVEQGKQRGALLQQKWDMDLNHLLAPEIHFISLLYAMVKLNSCRNKRQESSLYYRLSIVFPPWSDTVIWAEAHSLLLCARNQELFCFATRCNGGGGDQNKSCPHFCVSFSPQTFCSKSRCGQVWEQGGVSGPQGGTHCSFTGFYNLHLMHFYNSLILNELRISII